MCTFSVWIIDMRKVYFFKIKIFINNGILLYYWNNFSWHILISHLRSSANIRIKCNEHNHLELLANIRYISWGNSSHCSISLPFRLRRSEMYLLLNSVRHDTSSHQQQQAIFLSNTSVHGQSLYSTTLKIFCLRSKVSYFERIIYTGSILTCSDTFRLLRKSV